MIDFISLFSLYDFEKDDGISLGYLKVELIEQTWPIKKNLDYMKSERLKIILIQKFKKEK